MWKHTGSCLWEPLFTASTAIWGSAGVVHPPALGFVVARSLDVKGGSKCVLEGCFVLFFWIHQHFCKRKHKISELSPEKLHPELFSVELWPTCALGVKRGRMQSRDLKVPYYIHLQTSVFHPGAPWSNLTWSKNRIERQRREEMNTWLELLPLLYMLMAWVTKKTFE